MNSLTRSLGFMIFAMLLLALFGPTSRPVASETFPTEAAETGEACEFAANGLIMWSPAEIECPICHTKNVFMVWDSYGSYIYQFPSKYQLVFWPFIDGQSWYSCKKCRYTAFMGDFENVPKDKIDELRKMLEGVTLPAQPTRSEADSRLRPPYLEIPTSQRLLVVEKVKRLLGETSDDYWNHFYRVVGYHLDEETKKTEADEARTKSLAITERLLADKANDGRRKELLYIAGAMRHFLGDDKAALKNFEEAGTLSYSMKDLPPEQNKNYNEYLSSVIKEYIKLLHSGKGPRSRNPVAFIDGNL
jgi:uncharacterized protein (DUF2225 family)